MTRLTLLSTALLLALPACGDKDDDTGSHDGGSHDGGSHDGGAHDGGASDGGASDGGASDGGASDGGASDGGASDGGSGDGGASDGGSGDGGSGDGGSGDGGSGDGGSGDGGSADIEIAGAWLDGWGGDHQIDNETWSTYGGSTLYHLSVYDNALDFAVAQNDAANEWSAGLWSRFDWTWDDRGTLWFCQTAYAAESESAALETPRSDDTEPATGGCGGSFAWTRMDPAR